MKTITIAIDQAARTITAFIAKSAKERAPDERMEIVFPPGTYTIEEPICIRCSNVTITINGTIRNAPGNNQTCLIVSAGYNIVSDVTLQNVSIQGYGTIDQNSQNATPWNQESSDALVNGHAFVAYRINNLEIKGITVINSIVWAMTIELCNGFSVTGCTVDTGHCNNRIVGGRPTYLGGQDGIHSHDSSNGIIDRNRVTSGDDSIPISSARGPCGRIQVNNNTVSVRVFAYEADGVTLNNNSVSGRYGLAAFTLPQDATCSLEDVIFSENSVLDGQGLFAVFKDGPFDVRPTNIRFHRNIFAGQVSPGNPEVKPYPINFGWYIGKCRSLEFKDNVFQNIARKGYIADRDAEVFFTANTFSNFSVPHPRNLFPDQPDTIIWVVSAKSVTFLKNKFHKNEIVPIGFGGYGDFTQNVVGAAYIGGNYFEESNTRSTRNINEASIIYAYGVDQFSFGGNHITENPGQVISLRSCGHVSIQDNDATDICVDQTALTNGLPNPYVVINQTDKPGKSITFEGNKTDSSNQLYTMNAGPLSAAAAPPPTTQNVTAVCTPDGHPAIILSPTLALVPWHVANAFIFPGRPGVGAITILINGMPVSPGKFARYTSTLGTIHEEFAANYSIHSAVQWGEDHWYLNPFRNFDTKYITPIASIAVGDEVTVEWRSQKNGMKAKVIHLDQPGNARVAHVNIPAISQDSGSLVTKNGVVVGLVYGPTPDGLGCKVLIPNNDDLGGPKIISPRPNPEPLPRPDPPPIVLNSRKAIAVAISDDRAIAACDDGTVWLCIGEKWTQLPPIQ